MVTLADDRIGLPFASVFVRTPQARKSGLRLQARGRARDDSIEVVGIALRLHQAFTATVGAARPVGVIRRLAVVGGLDRLGRHGDDMDAAIAIVDASLLAVASPERVG